MVNPAPEIARMPRRALPAGVGAAFAAAMLFGASTPLARLLLGSISPLLLAGLLYLGSGLGLLLVHLVRPARSAEAPVTRKDLPWLSAAVICGGMLGPVLLMEGLARTPAAVTSLLLNLEGVFTATLAWFWFRENVDRRIALGMAAIILAGGLLSWSGGPSGGFTAGSLMVVGACLCWGLDNNFTQKVSASDPVQVAGLKGGVAGAVNLGIALGAGARIPAPPAIAGALVVGFLGYGVSLVLYVVALRYIGTARTGAYFSAAPFLGAGLSFALLRESVTTSFWPALALMALGVWLHLTERHDHEHLHEEMVHTHLHWHDEHHQHEHPPGVDPHEPHTHEHRHERLVHSHPHYPDIHHRHKH